MQLRLIDYEIEKKNKLIMQPSPYILEESEPKFLNRHLLYKDKEGNERQGSKAYFNNEILNCEILPSYINGIDTSNLFLHFSIPKIYNKGNNFYSVGREGSKIVIDKVEEELKEIGIKTNINKAKITRIDNFKNVVMEEKFHSYKTIFELLNMSRGKEKFTRQFGTTFLKGNATQQICIYDKIVEIDIKNIHCSKSGQPMINKKSLPDNVARFEHRIFKNKNIKQKLEIELVEDYYKKYDNIKDYYQKIMKNNLFKLDIEEIEILYSSKIMNEMNYFEFNYGRNWLQKYFQYKGIEALTKVNEEILKEAVRERIKDRKKVYRIFKDIREGKLIIEVMKSMEGQGKQNKTIGTLYNELKKKLIA